MIGEMIRLVLSAAGIPTIDRLKIGATPVVRRALLDGEVDLYVEYTGNGGIFFNMPADPAWKDFRKGYELGARLDYAKNRIVWLTPAPASNAWALAVRRDIADAYHLRTMSDFAHWVSGGGQVMLACSAEFANAGTLRSLEGTYGFKLTSDQMIVLAGGETTAMITAAAARTDGTNTAMVYATDGGIAAANLVVLEDDKHDQPIYAPVPLIRATVLRAHPGIAGLVEPLMESLDRETLQHLNERVQVDGESIESVARAYLAQKRLVRKEFLE
ncbi:MAG: ABC transporter substrate-binding protein [Gammaproteobacteria bacterium]|nr:ABC transporter substrate-binding protein [Gammaproteobacteria bacterium]